MTLLSDGRKHTLMAGEKLRDFNDVAEAGDLSPTPNYKHRTQLVSKPPLPMKFTTNRLSALLTVK